MGTANSLEWGFRFNAVLRVDDRDLFLFARSSGAYEGQLKPGAPPVNLKRFVNGILGDIGVGQLPSEFPDVILDELTVSFDKSRTHGTDIRRLQLTSAGQLGEPFGRIFPVNNTSLLHTSTRTGKDPAVSKSMVGVAIRRHFDPADLIADVLSIPMDDTVKAFLPVFKPRAEQQPIRLYYATESFADGPQTYQRGFNIDDLIVEVVGVDFLVSVNVHDGFQIKASASELDFGILTVKAPPTIQDGLGGPALTVVNQTTGLNQATGADRTAVKHKAIDLDADLSFFGGEPLILHTDYDSSAQFFSGSVTYDGTILGIQNPNLAFRWHKGGTFQIVNFPLPAERLGNFIDFAKKFQELSEKNPGDCGALVDLVFNETVTTEFSVTVQPKLSSNGPKPRSGPQTGGGPQLSILGTYNVKVLNHSVDDIQFDPIPVPIGVPRGFDDLGNAVIDTLVNAAEAIAGALWENRQKLTALLTLVTIKQGGKQAVRTLVCKAGNEALEKALDDAIDAAFETIGESGLATLTGAVATFVAAVGALAWLDKLASWFGVEDPRQAEAEQKEAEAGARIRELLALCDLVLDYVPGDYPVPFGLQASWSAPPDRATDQGIYYAISVSGGRTYRLGRDTPHIAVPDVENGRTYALSVQACFPHNGETYTGDPVSATVTLPILGTPVVAQRYDEVEQRLELSWPAVGPVEVTGQASPAPPVSYSIRLWDDSLNQAVNVAWYRAQLADGTPARLADDGSGWIIWVTPGSSGYTCVVALTEAGPPFFALDLTHAYEVRIEAAAANRNLNSAAGTGPAFTVAWGIGHMAVGRYFRVG